MPCMTWHTAGHKQQPLCASTCNSRLILISEKRTVPSLGFTRSSIAALVRAPLQAVSAFSKVRHFLRDLDPAESSDEARPSIDILISPTGKAAAASKPSSHAAEDLGRGDRMALPSSHATGVNEQRWRRGMGAAAAAAQSESEHGTGAAGASGSGAAEAAAAAGGSRAAQDGAEQEDSDAEMLEGPASGEAPEGASLQRANPLQQRSKGGAEGSKPQVPRQARSRQAPAPSQQVGAAPTLSCYTVPGSSLPGQLGHSWCRAGLEQASRWGLGWHALGR